MLQYPASLLTAAALVDSLVCVVARGPEVDVCEWQASSAPMDCECVCDVDISSSQTHLLEGNKLIENVILDVQDVLRLSNVSRVVFLPLLAEGCVADGTGRV